MLPLGIHLVEVLRTLVGAEMISPHAVFSLRVRAGMGQIASSLMIRVLVSKTIMHRPSVGLVVLPERLQHRLHLAVGVALVQRQGQVLSAAVVSATPLEGQGGEGEHFFRYALLLLDLVDLL